MDNISKITATPLYLLFIIPMLIILLAGLWIPAVAIVSWAVGAPHCLFG